MGVIEVGDEGAGGLSEDREREEDATKHDLLLGTDLRVERMSIAFL
jgi:hypothetical protein